MYFAKTVIVLALLLPGVNLLSQVEELDLFATSGQVESIDQGELEPWRQIIYETSCLSALEKAKAISLFEKLPFVDWHQLQAEKDINPDAIRCMVRSFQDGRTLIYRKEWDEKTRLSYIFRTRGGSWDGYHLLRLKSMLSSDVRMGLVLERDPNERFWFRNGPAYWGGFIEWNRPFRKIDKIILGDFKITLGQGLLFNNQFRKGLVHGAGQLPVIDHTDLLPFQGVDENRGLRGFAIKMRRGRLSWLLFGSARNQDASVTDENGIRSLQYSGRHVSQSEITNRDRLWVGLGGMGLTMKTRLGRVSFNQIYHHQDQSWSPSNEVRRTHHVYGKSFYGMSLSHRFEWHTLLLYGEIAYQPKRSPAFTQGAIINAGSHTWSMIIRHLPNDYIPQYTQGMFRTAFRNNETGLFLGYVFLPSSTYELSLNYDHTLLPWWSFNSGPGKTSEIFTLRLTKSIRKRSDQSLRLSHRTVRETDGQDASSSRLRYHLSLISSKGLEWRMRMELGLTKADQHVEISWLHYQEVKWSQLESPWQGLMRMTVYRSDSFEGRLYAYEHRLGGNFLIPPFYGQGVETYIMVKYRTGPLKISARVSLANRIRQERVATAGTSISIDWAL